MVKEKGLEALKNPVSSHTQAIFSQNDINSQVNDTQEPTNRAIHDLVSGSNIDLGQGRDAGTLYHQPTWAMDGASHQQADIPPLRAAARARRQDPIDDETLSRAKMWDPVKDCSDPNTIQAEPDFLPGEHNGSEQPMHSTTRDVAPTMLHFFQGDRPYGRGQDHRQHFTNSGTTGSAFMGLLPHPQSHAMASRYQGSALMASQAFQVGHPYDQFQRSGQHQSGHVNTSTLPPQLRESFRQNGQQSLESITRDTASMGIQPRQAGHENRQQFMALEPRMPAPMAPHESSRPLRSSPLIGPNLSTHGSTSEFVTSAELDGEQASRPQRPHSSISMSQAFDIARYAESMDQQSKIQEAVHAYDQACVMLQEVIMRSYNIEERMDCNNARNAYQARLNVLLQESAASLRNPAPEKDDQQDDDSPARGKPQYSLFEDWTLCHKEEEDLSWQEVAETPTFKGKRKHRSLSQRKHTIGKMGPKYHEAEIPWTVEDDMKLRALGDAGKTLGDIHRKFRSRNAERCLNRYFSLKGYRITGRGHTHISHHAGQAPVQYPLSTQHTHSSSVNARHRGYVSDSSTTVINPVSHGQSIGTVLQQNCQIPPNSGPDIPSASTRRHQTSGMPASSSSQPDAGPTDSTPSKALDTPPSPQAVGNERTDRLLTSRREIPPTSSSSSANNSATLTPNSSRSSSATLSPPPETHGFPDNRSAAANGVRRAR